MNEVQPDRDLFRKNLLQYTRQAFSRLSPFDEPLILDLGCGTGVQTIELAILSKGTVYAIDIDEIALEKLNKKIQIVKLGNRIKTVRGSVKELNFSKEYFDIIWAEGVIVFIGFEKALTYWGQYIKPNGYLVVHDDVKDYKKKLNLISNSDFQLINEIKLSKEIWWKLYYEPLEKVTLKIKKEFSLNKTDEDVIKANLKEINMFKETTDIICSIFYILKKVG